jgi:hypothetical protein
MRLIVSLMVVFLLGKLIREGKEPMSARVRYEYAALLRELINQCGMITNRWRPRNCLW